MPRLQNPFNLFWIIVDYFATRSFGDEFGGAITGDLLLVQVSYIVAFLFLGANLGRIKCGAGSRWTMALGALATVGYVILKLLISTLTPITQLCRFLTFTEPS